MTVARSLTRSMGRFAGRGSPYAVLAAAVAGAGIVAAVDPNQPGHYPTCPFLAVTGYYCPGCGSLRMIHALTHGHPVAAFGRNPLAFLTLPLLGYLWFLWAGSVRDGRQPRSRILRPTVITAFGALIVAFWVIRNLPFGHILAP